MKKVSNSTLLLIHRIIKSIADAIIKIYIPILIYQQTSNLTLSFVYFVVDFALTSLAFFAFRRLVQKFPLLSLIFSVVPIIASCFLLLLNLNIWLILALALCDVVSSALYYGSINMTFGLIDKSANAAKFESGSFIGKMVFSLLSAYVLGNLKNSLLFVVIASVSLYAICVIPIILKYKQIKSEIKQMPKNNQLLVVKQSKWHNIYHIFNGIMSFTVDHVLTLYLYVRGVSFTAVGFLVALQCLCSVLTASFTRLTEKKNITKYFLPVASSLIIASLLVLLLVNQLYVCYVFTVILTISHNYIYIATYRCFTVFEKDKNYFHDAVFYRDVFINAGRTISPALYLIAPFFPVVFGFGMASSIGYAFSSYRCLKTINVNQNLEEKDSQITESESREENSQ